MRIRRLTYADSWLIIFAVLLVGMILGTTTSQYIERNELYIFIFALIIVARPAYRFFRPSGI